MDSIRYGREIRLPAFVCAMLLMLPALCVSGIAAATVDAKALDARIEAWKDRAIRAAATLEEADDRRTCPVGSLVVYVETPGLNPLHASVTLTVDTLTPIERHYENEQAAALSLKGLDRLACFIVSPGRHRLTATIEWRNPRDSPDSPPSLARYEGEVAIDTNKNSYQLTLDSGGLLSSAGLLLDRRTATDTKTKKAWSVSALLPTHASTAYVPGGLDDPEFRYALYLAECRQRLRALARLWLIASSAPSAVETRIELSRRLLDFGAVSSADAVLTELEMVKTHRLAVQSLRVQEADQRYRQGNLEAAEAAIPKVSGPLAKQKPDWQDITFRVLLARGHFGEASDLALAMKNNADYESYIRYFNLGVALIQDGRYGQGATVLDRIGTIASEDATMRALVDRANLALALHFLRQQQAASAIPVLSRIRSEGPYGSQAILALGWSWLLPAGQKQTREALGDERVTGPPPESIGGRLGNTTDGNLYQRYRVSPFERTSLPNEETARLDRALAAWAELIDRDPAEPPVREGLVAIAGVLDRLGAHEDATRYYNRAIEALNRTLASLGRAQHIAEGEPWMDSVQRRDDGEDPGGPWKLRDLPSPALTQPLREAIAGNAFQEALQSLRDLTALQKTFVSFNEHLVVMDSDDPALLTLKASLNRWQTDIDADKELQRSELREMASSNLLDQADRVTVLLTQTRFAMARSLDSRAVLAGSVSSSH